MYLLGAPSSDGGQREKCIVSSLHQTVQVVKGEPQLVTARVLSVTPGSTNTFPASPDLQVPPTLEVLSMPNYFLNLKFSLRIFPYLPTPHHHPAP